VLWPLFHYEPNRLPLEVRDFEQYVAANRRFADAVVREHRAGDVVWIHDYQLFLVPQMVREMIPDARIGFFLHIPFPSSEIFRVLPHREEILEGVLAADLIGFHTAAYMRHFVSAMQHALDSAIDIDRVRHAGRTVHLGVFPMGIDAKAFASTASEPAVLREVFALQRGPDEKLLLGIDRLDYTKGIPRRLLAFECLLKRHPDLRGRVRLVQVGVPSRENVQAYQAFRSKTDELIGRIHGAFATPDWVPVHWIYRSLSHEDVVALYRAADVMVVTPLRDGMNLVAKEYVASRNDERGVLVLSEFAGAASELAEALLVNPFDVDCMAETLFRALTMPESEATRRMRALRERVFSFDSDLWGSRFLQKLETLHATDDQSAEAAMSVEQLVRRAKPLAEAPRLILLLDYDGTLVPLARTPELAPPDEELLELLAALCRRPRTDVHVVSGRSAATLQSWLGKLPIGLYAEHGIRSRHPGGDRWEPAPPTPCEWRKPVFSILHAFAERVPGSLVEDKGSCVAWHYRAAEPEFAERQARELRVHLLPLLSNEPVEILTGHKVIEVRPQGFHKGRIVERIRAAAPLGARIIAMGDDQTDEDMFAAVAEDDLSVKVGSGVTRARTRLRSVAAARSFLDLLLLHPARATRLHEASETT
jgi:trehalose 6-phosphate synthase/phosphatase